MEPVGLIPPLLGAPVVDAAGAPAGAVADLLADPVTGRPAWAVVRLPAGTTVTVPHAILRSHARDLALPCGADHLAAAPPPDQAAALCRHFDVAPWELPRPDALPGLAAGRVARSAPAAAPVGPKAPVATPTGPAAPAAGPGAPVAAAA